MLHLSYRLVSRGLKHQPCCNLRTSRFNQLSTVGYGWLAATTADHNQVIRGICCSTDHQPRAIRMSSRSASTKAGGCGPIRIHSLTKNLHFYSGSSRKWNKDAKTLRLSEPLEKPLVLLLCWLQASEKHLRKFAEFYQEQGFEVLVAHITPWQLMWPVYGSQAVAADIVKFLKNNTLEQGVVLHGFSVGGYLWGECLVRLDQDEDGKATLGKIKGQIWDSAADITEIPVGVPHAVLPKNPTLQGALRSYITYHLKLFHEEATQYYEKCNRLYFYEPARCPALLLVSKTDPVGTEAANRRLMATWDSVGVKTTIKCWDRSPHVGHFHRHRDEYIEQVVNHLGSLDIAGYTAPKAKL
ncbi:uncharacterized protein LOC6054370 [Culex quinquefasciatus]|uniref:uncharacterized protein LOC6054370 n=1 Tax=Culex quinquefasciatus TaxID=7176 RepID=UPI0018E34B1D|nr:uncharacterized protein LOC6054370 [Culex quinquefasciatus]